MNIFKTLLSVAFAQPQLKEDADDIPLEVASDRGQLMAADLPPAKTPAARNRKRVSHPSYITTTQTSDAILPVEDRRVATTDPETYRTNARNTRELIRSLTATNSDLSAAINSYLRTAITDTYTALAKNAADGTINEEGTKLVNAMLARFNVMHDDQNGFGGVMSMRSLSESLGLELMRYGSCCLELVLDRVRLPARLEPVSTTKVFFRRDGKILKPHQLVGGEEINLDIPTFFYTAVDQDLLAVYSDSPFEAGVQPTLASQSFLSDLRRVVRRALHPRLEVVIDEEKFKKNIPVDILYDDIALKEYMDTMISQIETKVNSLKPEDAVVYFDTLGISYVTAGNNSYPEEVKALNTIIDSKLASGAKTLPSVLGHGSTGSQNIASSETLMHLKSSTGLVQEKLNEIYSRAFTLAVRLFGLDVYVEFKYKEVNLRPELELEAFKAMRQSRVLELLSLGILSDTEATIQLTGGLPAAGAPALQGTNFMMKKGDTENDNPYSNTSESTLNKATDSKAPDGEKSNNQGDS